MTQIDTKWILYVQSLLDDILHIEEKVIDPEAPEEIVKLIISIAALYRRGLEIGFDTGMDEGYNFRRRP